MDKEQEGSKCSHKMSSIVAHVPDIVVYSCESVDIPHTQQISGVLLFADISGFTALTEKFSLSNKKDYGADELTQTLNSYIGEIVSYILADGGDILNYAGDAILALWTVERMQLSEAISLVVRCSLNIQYHCGVRETEVGCQLRVKIGISAGKLSKVIVGDETKQYYVVIGGAVDEVRLAEGLAEAGTIILSPNAWELCERQNLAIDRIENERAVKVRYIKRAPSFSVENYLKEMGNNLEHENLQRSCLRKASRLKPNDERESFMRKYIMKVVLQKIDDNQPLKYLSEMRPATIVFVNLQFEDGKCDMEQCVAIHRAALYINQQMLCHQGQLNKVFMFDKGCTFLCLFGLPGNKRADESAHALQAAHSIQEACLLKIKILKTVSVGVTTGTVFCGVVGHPLRHEYTVIGQKVNLAARLMMYYPGVVSCDNETRCYSRLPSFYFVELPRKELKGIHRPCPVYQFMANRHQTRVGKAPISFERDKDHPLLGRQKELRVYSTSLKDFLDARSSSTKTCSNVVIYEGATGYGKSHLLAEIVYRASKEKVRVMSLELTKADIKRPNYMLQTLLALLLSVQDCKGFAERERVILSKILDPELRENVCFLNDILLVKFPVSYKVSLMDSETKSKEMRKYFLQLFCKLAEETPCVYVMDQAHFADQASLRFLLEVCEQASLLIFMALLPQTSVNGLFPELVHIIHLPRTIYLKLPVLDPPIITQLACQILGVVRIPSEVKLFLVERSHGVPYYCKELLKNLYLSGMIVIEAVEEEQHEDMSILFSEPCLVGCSSIPSQVWQGREDRDYKMHSESSQPRCTVVKARKIQALDRSPTEQSFVCLVVKSAKFHEVPIPLTLKGMALAQLDQLQPAEQMVLKCAAIIGSTFTTQMLLDILPDVTQQKLNRSLVSLFKSNMFECASKQMNLSLPLSKEAEHFSMLSCYCAGNDHTSNTDEVKLASVADVWKCQMICFCTSLLKETAYELWLKEEKKEIHSKCASYLQQQPYRCHVCGTDEFICGHKAAIGGRITERSDDLKQESCEKMLLNSSSLRLHRDTIQSNWVCPVEENGNDVQNFLAMVDLMVRERQAHMATGRSGGCKCGQLVKCVLIPLVRHWIGVGDVCKAFFYLLESAAACTYLSDCLRALSFLNEAKIILENLKAGKPAFETADPKVKVRICKFEKACLFRLTGESLFNTGRILLAEENFVTALRLLNKRFPRNQVCLSMKYIYEKMKNLPYKSQDFEIPQERELAFLQECIYCLSYLWKISCMRSLPQSASLAITMEMNIATCSAEKFKVLFSAIDYFQYSQIVGHEVECNYYERLLCRRCADQSYCPKDLLLISHFIHTIAIVKLCAGNLEQSVLYTMQAQKVSKVLKRPGLDMWAISMFYMPLLLTSRNMECVELIQSLEDLEISVAKGWFCAACFSCLLYAGFSLRSFEECLTFVEGCQSDSDLVADKSLMMSLYSALALWYARLAEWENVAFFYNKAFIVYVEIPTSVHSISGVVMFLECSVLLIRKALMEHNKHIKTIYNKTLKHFSDFHQCYANNHIFLPRVLHLKAFLYLLVGHETLAMGILKHALLLSEKQGNLLDQSWIRQSEAAWSGAAHIQSSADWLAATLNMPRWEEAVKLQPKELLRYRFILTNLSLQESSDSSSVLLPPQKKDMHMLIPPQSA